MRCGIEGELATAEIPARYRRATAAQAIETAARSSKMQYRSVRAVTDRQKTDSLRSSLGSSNHKFASCVQTLHAKGLGRLASAVGHAAESMGRGVQVGVQGLSGHRRFKHDSEDVDSD